MTNSFASWYSSSHLSPQSPQSMLLRYLSSVFVPSADLHPTSVMSVCFKPHSHSRTELRPNRPTITRPRTRGFVFCASRTTGVTR